MNTLKNRIETNIRVRKAYDFMVAAHESIGQKRKYTLEPYWHHTYRVAELVHQHVKVHTEDCIIAAKIHDVLEDVFPKNPYYSLDLIKSDFGPYVAQLVDELTHRYTAEMYPDKNRAKRKNMEAQRLSWISVEAQTIKYADILDNVRDLKVNDPNFADIYIQEKRDILRMMNKGNETLYQMTCEEVGLI